MFFFSTKMLLGKKITEHHEMFCQHTFCWGKKLTHHYNQPTSPNFTPTNFPPASPRTFSAWRYDYYYFASLQDHGSKISPRVPSNAIGWLPVGWLFFQVNIKIIMFIKGIPRERLKIINMNHLAQLLVDKVHIYIYTYIFSTLRSHLDFGFTHLWSWPSLCWDMEV